MTSAASSSSSSSPSSCSVFIRTIEGLDDIRLECPVDTPITELTERIYSRLPPRFHNTTSISTRGGISIKPYKSLDDLLGTDSPPPLFVNLMLRIPLCGGKGGFGQMLKARGRTMNKKKNKNDRSSTKELYNTLDGRRVKTLKRLKQLEHHMASLPEKERAKLKEKRNKLQSILDMDLEKNVKFEDTEFLGDIEKQVDEIRGSFDGYMSEGSADDIESEDDSDFDGGSSDTQSDNGEKGASSEAKPSSSKAKFLSFFDEPDHQTNSPKVPL